LNESKGNGAAPASRKRSARKNVQRRKRELTALKFHEGNFGGGKGESQTDFPALKERSRTQLVKPSANGRGRKEITECRSRALIREKTIPKEPAKKR